MTLLGEPNLRGDLYISTSLTEEGLNLTIRKPRWLATNLLLLAGTIFVGVLLFFLSDLFTEEARSTAVIVEDALFGALFFGVLILVPALPFAVAYLLLVRRIAQRVSGVRLRALALLLSPIVMLYLFFLLETWYPLALALPFGAVIRLPKQNHVTLANA
jgi:hypothetical protein